MVTLLRLAACSVPLLIGLTSRCFAHRARASCAPRHCHPQFAMVVPRRAQSALAALPPLSSAWSLRIVRKLTRGSPCFTGLIGGYCSHWLRRLFRPHWAYYGLFRALRAAKLRPHWAYYGLFPPQAAAFVRPF